MARDRHPTTRPLGLRARWLGLALTAAGLAACSAGPPADAPERAPGATASAPPPRRESLPCTIPP